VVATKNTVGDIAINQVVSVPAPVGGWNAKDSLANMPADQAVILDNWFPSAGTVDLRRGTQEFATGVGGASDSVETLATWSGATQKMIAVSTDNKVYDVSTSGAASNLTGSLTVTNSRWQTTNFTSAAGQFLLMVNGVDTPLKYNGTTVTTNSWTGSLTDTDVIHLHQHHNRLFLIEKDTLSFWYVNAADTFSGAVSEFPVGSNLNLGGYLMAMGTWTLDAGDGQDDKAVFVTSNGEVLVYSGIDPSSPNTWALEGVYRTGAPIGRRCLSKLGGDMVIITENGFIPMSKLIQTGDVRLDIAISDRISPAVNQDVRSHGTKWGWEAIVYPKGGYMLFNIPTAENAKAEQYVVNTTTGAWCSFGRKVSPMNANTWNLLNNNLYYGTNDGRVVQADVGTSDEGVAITADGMPAFSYFGTPGQNKLFNLARMTFQTEGDIAVNAEMRVDFDIGFAPTATSTSVTGGATWDVAAWDTEFWASDLVVVRPWIGVAGLGISGSLRARVNSASQSIHWVSNDYQYEVGGGI
jgi:hypothetical protein